jgi:hypothetical protein
MEILMGRHALSVSPYRYRHRSNNSMKRLKRIIFNGLTMLSLVLFVATAVLWVRRYKIAYLPTYLHLNSSSRLVIATQIDLFSFKGR